MSLSGRSFSDGGACTRLIGIVNDITERKLAETALQDLNQTLTLRVAHKTAERDHLWQLSKDLMAVMTPAGALIEVNPAWQASLGHGTSEVVGEHLAKFAHPDDAAVVRASDGAGHPGESAPVRMPLRLPRTARAAGFHGRQRSGHGCIYAVGRDITEDKRRNLSSNRRRKLCVRRRRWKPSASSPAAWRTTSTICCRSWSATSKHCNESCRRTWSACAARPITRWPARSAQRISLSICSRSRASSR